MGKVLVGIFAAVASLVLAETLTCNNCNYGLFGFCLTPSEETCSTNTSVCFTGRAIFPSVSSSAGFNTQGCREPAGCNETVNGTLLFIAYETTVECCSTGRCNPVTLSSAPTSKMTLSAVIGAAVLAYGWGSMTL